MFVPGFYDRLAYAKKTYNPNANCFGTALFALGLTNADGGIFCDSNDISSLYFLNRQIAKMTQIKGNPDLGNVVLIREARTNGFPVHMAVVTKKSSEILIGGRRGLGLDVGYFDSLLDNQSFYQKFYQSKITTHFLHYSPF